MVGARTTTFLVRSTTVVREADYVAFVLRPAASGARVLRLFACHPTTSRRQRIVVEARA